MIYEKITGVKKLRTDRNILDNASREELTGFLPVVDGTGDSASSLVKLATAQQLLHIGQSYSFFF